MLGWLMDIKAKWGAASLLFKTEQGTHVAEEPYRPYFYLACKEPDLAASLAEKHPLASGAGIEWKFASLQEKEKRKVVRVGVERAEDLERVARDCKRLPGIEEIAECSIPHYFRHLVERNLRFFECYEIEGTRIMPADRLRMPKLRAAAAAACGNGIAAIAEGKRPVMLKAQELGAWLSENNIDALITWGWNGTLRVPSAILHLDLAIDMGYDIYTEKIDLPKSMEGLLLLGEKRLLRTIELSHMTGARPNDVSRMTPGRLNTFLHIRSAKQMGYIVPDLKREVERPKSLRTLIALDKGGTIFYPAPGIYENVAKCDFASMYPNIIVKYNISPEKMDCENCKKPIDVPEAGWRICGEEQGIIPRGIEDVLNRRLELKRRMKNELDTVKKTELDMRQKALKNILVTCFGYLGFNNFVFSNVECKECVMLYGRHIMARAKEIAEEMGLRVLYGIVDSIFVSGGTRKKYAEFAEKVSMEIGIELVIDCVFNRLVFPSGRDSSGVANKYYGISSEGGLEARGIALRHSDACRLVKDYQARAAKHILEEGNAKAGFIAGESMLAGIIGGLRQGKYHLDEFIITKPLRKPLKEYVANAPHVVAFRKAPCISMVSKYVYSTGGPKPYSISSREEIDIRKYEELLLESLAELVRGII